MPEIKVGLIGGTGLGESLGAQAGGTRHQVETPFGDPSGAVLEAEWAGLPVCVLGRHGPGHTLNPTAVPYRANIFALKKLGCTHVIASGAVGSLREEFRPRHLVIPDQLIDKTSRRCSTFYERAAVHVEFAEPFCPVLRQILLKAGEAMRVPDGELSEPLVVHERGCYVAMEGPAFSTRAESLMHRIWGGDLIGMTLMPEAKLAREAELSYAAIALVTDYDCWRRPGPAAQRSEEDAKRTPPAELDPDVLLKEIIANVQSATNSAIALMRRAVELLAERRETLPPSPAHQALRLAIWSDKKRLAADEIERLRPLWGRYFE